MFLAMEFLHMDVWTSADGDITDLETSLINNASGTVHQKNQLQKV